MKKIVLPVESVRERDIDFLLVEELLSSVKFVNYFLGKLTLPECDELIEVQRSINDFGLGETDVLIEYKHRDTSIGVLVENKLDALFQPEQAERYTSRAEQYVVSGKYHQTYAILVAPQQYIEKQNDFQHCISYEDIAEYFKNSDLGDRGEFKETLLKIASEKLRRGYVAINSEPNQEFWTTYYNHISVAAPMIMMKPVSVVPANSDWIDLTAGRLKFVHKLSKGYLDFSLKDEDAINKLEKIFPGRTEKLNFKSGDILRIRTTPLDRMSDFQYQIENVNECINDMKNAAILISSEI